MVDHSPLFRALGYKPIKPVEKVVLPDIPAGIGIVGNLPGSKARLDFGGNRPLGFKMPEGNPFAMSHERAEVKGQFGLMPYIRHGKARDFLDIQSPAKDSEFCQKLREHMAEMIKLVGSPEYATAIERSYGRHVVVTDSEGRFYHMWLGNEPVAAEHPEYTRMEGDIEE